MAAMEAAAGGIGAALNNLAKSGIGPTTASELFHVRESLVCSKQDSLHWSGHLPSPARTLRRQA
jgi:hypothetical protein